MKPDLVSIDGGPDQTTMQSFNTNGESDLDLQYSMTLVGKTQPVTLYQVGDLIEGEDISYPSMDIIWLTQAYLQVVRSITCWTRSMLPFVHSRAETIQAWMASIQTPLTKRELSKVVVSLPYRLCRLFD